MLRRVEECGIREPRPLARPKCIQWDQVISDFAGDFSQCDSGQEEMEGICVVKSQMVHKRPGDCKRTPVYKGVRALAPIYKSSTRDLIIKLLKKTKFENFVMK